MRHLSSALVFIAGLAALLWLCHQNHEIVGVIVFIACALHAEAICASK